MSFPPNFARWRGFFGEKSRKTLNLEKLEKTKGVLKRSKFFCTFFESNKQRKASTGAARMAQNIHGDQVLGIKKLDDHKIPGRMIEKPKLHVLLKKMVLN